MLLSTLVSRIKHAFSPAKVGVWILVIISLIALFFIVQSLSSFYALRKTSWRAHMLQQPRTVTTEDIQGWMTFEYLNVVFKLPPEYLREALSIETAKYPRITLRRYAEQSRIDPPALIRSVQEAIAEYR
ncbi:MAG: hypothetical protein A3E38_00560 [Candidatus Moranbacteria bacterium RIFCSPHIGHO2_12_FULL_54_9]|nr:MAG: hypothetical protein A2878_00790 [Candidatus Moranbacteria bacterium RIFCSPHIGHO2_01_FULL_54_31]OGI24737.1 MAG: hypothetical protein A3E38_00560 [Candidatus Moranbacteria bacterium RIFCSPHIGHO2_12_FULL_54_9]